MDGWSAPAGAPESVAAQDGVSVIATTPRTDAPSVAAPLAFAFSGSGAEYFRIWIVNLLLTVVTLGIYSAWAKTRRLQYFYRNTRLADASFDFRGDPKAILRGRILAVLLLQYSRAMELEADDYAAEVLRRNGQSPEYFADILQELERGSPSATWVPRWLSHSLNYLSTHPATDERIARLRARPRP